MERKCVLMRLTDPLWGCLLMSPSMDWSRYIWMNNVPSAFNVINQCLYCKLVGMVEQRGGHNFSTKGTKRNKIPACQTRCTTLHLKVQNSPVMFLTKNRTILKNTIFLGWFSYSFFVRRYFCHFQWCISTVKEKAYSSSIVLFQCGVMPLPDWNVGWRNRF